MNPVLFIRQTPFLRVRLIAFTVLATIVAIIIVIQLSQRDGWLKLHQDIPLVIVIELLPVVLLGYLFTITPSANTQKEELNQGRQELIISIAETIDKIKSGEYDKDKDQTGNELIDSSLRNIYDKFK